MRWRRLRARAGDTARSRTRFGPRPVVVNPSPSVAERGDGQRRCPGPWSSDGPVAQRLRRVEESDRPPRRWRRSSTGAAASARRAARRPAAAPGRTAVEQRLASARDRPGPLVLEQRAERQLDHLGQRCSVDLAEAARRAPRRATQEPLARARGEVEPRPVRTPEVDPAAQRRGDPPRASRRTSTRSSASTRWPARTAGRRAAPGRAPARTRRGGRDDE